MRPQGGCASHSKEPCDHHAEISIDDPKLSDEARCAKRPTQRVGCAHGHWGGSRAQALGRVVPPVSIGSSNDDPTEALASLASLALVIVSDRGQLHGLLDHRVDHEYDTHGLSPLIRAWMTEHPDERLPLHLCPTHGDCNTVRAPHNTDDPPKRWP